MCYQITLYVPKSREWLESLLCFIPKINEVTFYLLLLLYCVRDSNSQCFFRREELYLFNYRTKLGFLIRICNLWYPKCQWILSIELLARLELASSDYKTEIIIPYNKEAKKTGRKVGKFDLLYIYYPDVFLIIFNNSLTCKSDITFFHMIHNFVEITKYFIVEVEMEGFEPSCLILSLTVFIQLLLF